MAEDVKPSKPSWWHTLPGALTAIAGVVTAITGLIVGVHQTGWISSNGATIANKDATKPPQQTRVPSHVAAASTDIDHPTRLTSTVIEGLGIAEAASNYYSFLGGPGYVGVKVRARNMAGYSANALGVAISKRDGARLVRIDLGYADEYKTESAKLPMGQREQMVLRIDLDPHTVDYKIELSGAVGFE
jgi:hypothetical protein